VHRDHGGILFLSSNACPPVPYAPHADLFFREGRSALSCFVNVLGALHAPNVDAIFLPRSYRRDNSVFSISQLLFPAAGEYRTLDYFAASFHTASNVAFSNSVALEMYRRPPDDGGSLFAFLSCCGTAEAGRPLLQPRRPLFAACGGRHGREQNRLLSGVDSRCGGETGLIIQIRGEAVFFSYEYLWTLRGHLHSS